MDKPPPACSARSRRNWDSDYAIACTSPTIFSPCTTWWRMFQWDQSAVRLWEMPGPLRVMQIDEGQSLPWVCYDAWPPCQCRTSAALRPTEPWNPDRANHKSSAHPRRARTPRKHWCGSRADKRRNRSSFHPAAIPCHSTAQDIEWGCSSRRSAFLKRGFLKVRKQIYWHRYNQIFDLRLFWYYWIILPGSSMNPYATLNVRFEFFSPLPYILCFTRINRSASSYKLRV